MILANAAMPAVIQTADLAALAVFRFFAYKSVHFQAL